MKIPTKDEYFKKMRSDPDFLSLLKRASTQERKQILSTIEYFAESMYDMMIEAMASTVSNPGISNEIDEALKNGVNIVKESDGSPITPKQKS